MSEALLALSPLDGRYLSKVKELRPHFSEYALIRCRLQVEVEWLIALADRDETPLAPFTPEQKKRFQEIYQNLTPEKAQWVKEREKITNHDVKAVEHYIGEQLERWGMEKIKPWVHFACTSEDINNLSHALMLQGGLGCLLPVMEEILADLKTKAEQYRHIPMMSKTHGQPATPTTAGKEMINVHARLKRQLTQLQAQEFLGKINGAVGNFNAHRAAFAELPWRGFSQEFVESLGLSYNPYTTQIEPHDYMAELFDALARFNNILLDFNRDMWGYISNEYFTQIPVQGETGSSTMPHKVNPIDFENSEGNLGLANAIFAHLAAKLPVSRWQRDLTDSTVLRNIGVGFGYSLLAYRSLLKGLGKVKLNEAKLAQDLSQAWPLLGEAVQTVMRKYGMADAYDQLKEFTRGREIEEAGMKAFIQGLALPEEVKRALLELKPDTYLGFAKEF